MAISGAMAVDYCIALLTFPVCAVRHTSSGLIFISCRPVSRLQMKPIYVECWEVTIYLHDYLDASGPPLAPLPFVGAVYRTGHAESFIGFRGIFQTVFPA